MKILRAAHAEPLVWGKDFIAVPSMAETDLALTAQVVFVGYGIVAPEFGIDDYKGLDVRGKVVAYLSGAPPKLSSELRAHLSSGLLKQTTASARGAVGSITVWDAETEKRVPFTRMVAYASVPSLAWLDIEGVPNGNRNSIPRLGYFSESGTRKLLGGVIFGPDSARTNLPVSITARIVSKHSEVISENVVAVLPGSDLKLKHEYVVYTAHLDHLGIGKPVNGDAIYNGAFDDAAGVAAVIEIARAFQSLKQRTRRSLIFIAVTGEEKGLLGSDYYAQHPTVPKSQITADINIDSIDLLYDFRDVVVLGSEHSSLGQVVNRVATSMGLEVSPDNQPEQVYFIRSDQYSFVRIGIPSILPNNGSKAVDSKIDGAKLDREWMQERYHRPNDDINQPMDFNAGVKNTRFDFLLGYAIAQNHNRPSWKPGDFFGKTFANTK